jgi:hypothetical protein
VSAPPLIEQIVMGAGMIKDQMSPACNNEHMTTSSTFHNNMTNQQPTLPDKITARTPDQSNVTNSIEDFSLVKLASTQDKGPGGAKIATCARQWTITHF